jgi:polyisoprenoid-binding protein YceI
MKNGLPDQRAAIVALVSLLFLFAGARPASGALQEENASRVRYRIDASKSRFLVRAFAGGVFSAFAHDHTIAVRAFDGQARFTPGDPKSASLRVTIKAGSLAVIDKISEEDRKEIESTMRENVLEISKYPEITFSSTSVSASKHPEGHYEVTISGDLTLHGVTRNRRITATVDFDGDTLRVKGEFSLLQTDYEITPVSIALGTIRVKDELRLLFDVIAIKQ